jgi:hypothetical protein
VTDVSSSQGAPAPAGTGIDTTVPHSARIWNYWLGGKDNYAVDREAGEAYKEVFPGIAVVARTSRAFLTRAVMGHFTDDEAYPIVSRLQAGLPSGSYFALYDGASTNEAFNQAQQGYNDSGAVPYHLRSPEQFRRYFEGLDLVEPGVVPLVQWRPDPDTEQAEIYSYCGVGRKP